MKKQIIYLAVITSMLAGLTQCGTTTKLTAHWADKDYQKGQIKEILILGIARSEAIRRTFEDDMTKKLEFYGVEGTPSSEVFPFDEKLDTTTFRLHFKNEGFDAVLTCQLVSEDKEQRYQPGYNSGYSAYGRPGFYGYYGSSWDNMYSPGYTYTTTTIKIETHLYDTKSEKLIWTGISETFDPTNDLDAIRSLNQTITRELNKQGYFFKEEK